MNVSPKSKRVLPPETSEPACPNILVELIRKTGFLRINTKIFYVLGLLLIIGVSSGVTYRNEQLIDKRMLMTNDTLEKACASTAMEEILSKIQQDYRGNVYYNGTSMSSTLETLELLRENRQLITLNASIRSYIEDWVLSQRKPIYTENETYQDHFIRKTNPNGTDYLVNEPIKIGGQIESSFWWGNIRNSLQAGRILKLIGALNSTILNDIKKETINSSSDYEPIFSITHKEFPKLYEAFELAYEYELFDLMKEFGYPEITEELWRNIIESEGAYQPFEIERVVESYTSNLTYYRGSNETHVLRQGENLSVKLPTIADIFADTGIKTAMPYQMFNIEWVLTEVPNLENITYGLMKGLVERVFVNESYLKASEGLKEYLGTSYKLEPVYDAGLLEGYEYYIWNDDTLWYEMYIDVIKTNTGERLERIYSNPIMERVIYEPDLRDLREITFTVTVRQALHSAKIVWDNNMYDVPIEGWKNETSIMFNTAEGYTLVIDDSSNNATLTYQTPEVIIDSTGNKTEVLVDKSIYIKNIDKGVHVVEAGKELHTLSYESPFKEIPMTLNVTHNIRPVLYGMVNKSDDLSEMFLYGEPSMDGYIYTWNIDETEPLEVLREDGRYSLGSVDSDGFTMLNERKAGTYHLLLYPSKPLKDNTTTVPLKVSNKIVKENKYVGEDALRYFTLMNESISVFTRYDFNITEMNRMWIDLNYYIDILTRVCDDNIALHKVINTYPLLDLLYSYQNTSSLFFKDSIKETYLAWEKLIKLGYFDSLVSDEEINKIYTQLMEDHFVEEYKEYTMLTTGEKVSLLERASFVENTQSEEYYNDVETTLYGVKLLKLIRARDSSLTILLNPAIDNARNTPLKLDPKKLPHYGSIWKVHVAQKSLEEDYWLTAVKAAMAVQNEVMTKYDVAYEEIYHRPKLVLNKGSALIPENKMFWSKEEEILGLSSPVNLAVYLLISIGLIFTTVLAGTDLGSNYRKTLLTLFTGILVLLQSVGQPMFMTDGAIKPLAKQIEMIGKIVKFLEDKVYELTSTLVPERRFERNYHTESLIVRNQQKTSTLADKLEDKSTQGRYERYCHELSEFKHRIEALYYSTRGVTFTRDGNDYHKMSYLEFLHSQINNIAETESQKIAGAIKEKSEEVLEEVKAIKVPDGLKNLMTPHFGILESLAHPRNVLSSMKTKYAAAKAINNLRNIKQDIEGYKAADVAADLEKALSLNMLRTLYLMQYQKSLSKNPSNNPLVTGKEHLPVDPNLRKEQLLIDSIAQEFLNKSWDAAPDGKSRVYTLAIKKEILKDLAVKAGLKVDEVKKFKEGKYGYEGSNMLKEKYFDNDEDIEIFYMIPKKDDKGKPKEESTIMFAVVTKKSFREVAQKIKRLGLVSLMDRYQTERFLRDLLPSFAKGKQTSLYNYQDHIDADLRLSTAFMEQEGEIPIMVVGAAEGKGMVVNDVETQNRILEATALCLSEAPELDALDYINNAGNIYNLNDLRDMYSQNKKYMHPRNVFAGVETVMPIAQRVRVYNIKDKTGTTLVKKNVEANNALVNELSILAEMQKNGNKIAIPKNYAQKVRANFENYLEAQGMDRSALNLRFRNQVKGARESRSPVQATIGIGKGTLGFGAELVERLATIAYDRLKGDRPDPVLFRYIEKINNLITMRNKKGGIYVHEDINTAIFNSIINMLTYILGTVEVDKTPYEIYLEKLLKNVPANELEYLGASTNFKQYNNVKFWNVGLNDLIYFSQTSGKTSEPRSGEGRFMAAMLKWVSLIYGEDIAKDIFGRKMKYSKAYRKNMHLVFDHNSVGVQELASFKALTITSKASEGMDSIFIKKKYLDGKPTGTYHMSFFEWKRKTLGKVGKGVGKQTEHSEGHRGGVARSKATPTEIVTGMSMLGLYMGICINSDGGFQRFKWRDEKGNIQDITYQRYIFNEVQYLRRIGKVEFVRGIISDLGQKRGKTSKGTDMQSMVIDFRGWKRGRDKTGRINSSVRVVMGDGEFDSRMVEAVGKVLEGLVEKYNRKIGGKKYEEHDSNVDDAMRMLSEFEYQKSIKASDKELVGSLFSEFMLYHLMEETNPKDGRFKAKTTGIASEFWGELMNEMAKFCLARSPGIPSLASNFILNWVNEMIVTLNQKMAAMTEAYYGSLGYEKIQTNGQGYVQGKIEDSTLTMIKGPDFLEERELTLDWGSNLTRLNAMLDRTYPADGLLLGVTRQVWDNTKKSYTLENTVDASADKPTIAINMQDKVEIGERGIMALTGTRVPLEVFPYVKWDWRCNVKSDTPSNTNRIREWYANWNQGQIIFEVKNKDNDKMTIGFMATTDDSGRSGLWYADSPDVDIYLDPITWVREAGEIQTDGSIALVRDWVEPFVPEQVNLYQMVKNEYLKDGLSAENLELVGIKMASGVIDFDLGNEDQETLFGGITFSNKSESEYTYKQSVVKTFYNEYIDADGEITLEEEETYKQKARELSIGAIDSISGVGIQNSQDWFIEAKKQDVYDEFAEFIAHGIALVKDNEGKYIGAFHNSYVFPEDAETLTAPKWTVLPTEQSIPVYIYYDWDRTNGWDRDLWSATVDTLAGMLSGKGLPVITVDAEDLVAVMADENTRSITIILGAIPTTVWGYINNSEPENTTSEDAKANVEQKSLIEKYLDSGGTLISAGPFGGLRKVCYVDEYGVPDLADYRNATLPGLEGASLTIQADIEKILDINFDPFGTADSAVWMDEGVNGINNYYSTGLYFADTSIDARVLQIYNSNGSRKDVALKVGKGIFVNYHTAEDNSYFGALNSANVQAFIDDVVTIVTGIRPVGTATQGFTPNNSWIPSEGGKLTNIALEGFGIIGESGYVDVGATAKIVRLSAYYKDPVVVAVPELGATESRSGTVTSQHHIITNVKNDQFTIKQVESGSGDSIVDTTRINYLVMEKGTYVLDGMVVEVGTASVTGSYQSITYTTTFTNTPIVLAATQTNNNNGKVRTRVANMGGTGFQIQVENGDSSTPSLAYSEMIGYIAIEQGHSSKYMIETRNTPDEVTHTFKAYSYNLDYKETPIILAHLGKEDGGDPSLAVVRDINTSDFEIAVEETCGCDGAHTTEILSWVAVPHGVITTNMDGVAVSEYPNIALTLLIEQKVNGLNTDLREYYNFATAYDSEINSNTTVKPVEGSSAIKFTYDLISDGVPDSTAELKQLSTIDIQDLTIDSSTIWTFAVRNELQEGYDLMYEIDYETDPEVAYELEVLKKPDIWSIIFTIDDGTGVTKKLYYYYSFKTPQYLGGNIIIDSPTDFTQYYDIDSQQWARVTSIPNGDFNDDTRFVPISMLQNDDWERLSFNIINDFNRSFVVWEDEITIQSIDICYTATNNVKSTVDKNVFYIDDFVFIDPEESTEYTIEQDYTDGINKYRLFTVVSDEEGMTIDGIERENGEVWYSDGSEYDIGILSMRRQSKSEAYALDGTIPKKLMQVMIDSQVEIPTDELLYYDGPIRLYTNSTEEGLYVENMGVYTNGYYNEVMRLESGVEYQPAMKGLSLYINGGATGDYKVTRLLDEPFRAKDYNNISFNIRSDYNSSNPVKLLIYNSDLSKNYYVELVPNEEWEFLMLDVGDFIDSDKDNIWNVEGIDVEIGKIVIEAGSNKIFIDDLMVSGGKGVLFLDDYEEYVMNENYSGFEMPGTYMTDEYQFSGDGTSKISADNNNSIVNSVALIDITEIGKMIASVVGEGTFKLTMDIYKENGTKTREWDFGGTKTLTGWDTHDEIELTLPTLSAGERFLGNPRISGNVELIFYYIGGLPRDYVVSDGNSSDGGIISESYYTNFNKINEEDWTDNMTEYMTYDDNTGTYVVDWKKTGIVSRTNGTTIETRVRVRESEYGEHGAFVIYVYDGTDFFIVTIQGNYDQGTYPDRVDVEYGSYSHYYWTDSGKFNATEWHTIRLTTQNGSSRIYVDGSLIYGPWTTNRTSTANQVLFGSLWSSSYKNSVDIDYFYVAKDEVKSPSEGEPVWDYKTEGNDNGSFTLVNDGAQEVEYGKSTLMTGLTKWVNEQGSMKLDSLNEDTTCFLVTRNDYYNTEVSTSFIIEATGTSPELGYTMRYENTKNYVQVLLAKEGTDWVMKCKTVVDGVENVQSEIVNTSISIGERNILKVELVNEVLLAYLNTELYDFGGITVDEGGYFGLYGSGIKASVGELYIYERVTEVDTTLIEGLVGLYSFDNVFEKYETGSINEYVVDMSGNKNHGKIIESLIDDGRKGKGIFFDGIDDYVEINEVSDYFVNQDELLTISTWVKTTTTETDAILGVNTSSHGNVVLLFVTSGKFRIHVSHGSSGYADYYASTINDGEWHNLVFTHDGTTDTGKMYVDGEIQEITKDGSVIGNSFTDYLEFSSTDLWSIGQEWDTDQSDFYSGWIDEVKIFDRVLGSEEINKIYKRESITVPLGTAVDPIAELVMVKTKNPDYKADTANQPQYLFFDQSGNDNNFVLREAYGNVEFDYLEDNFKFDATYQTYIESKNDIGNTPQTTLSIWAKPIGSKTSRYRLMESGDEGNWFWEQYNSKISFDNLVFAGIDTYELDQYNNFVVTVNEGEKTVIRLYVNGNLEDTWTGTWDMDLGKPIMGGESLGWNGYFGGLKIWDKALSSEEVFGLYAEGAGSGYSFIGKEIELETQEYPLGNTTEWEASFSVLMGEDYAPEVVPSGWTDELTSLSTWNQAKDDPNVDNANGNYDYQYDIVMQSRGEDYTPQGVDTANYWWNSGTGTNDLRAGVYRELTNIQENNAWEIEAHINFNNYSGNNPYTFRGWIMMTLLNSNYEPMFRSYIGDGAASSSQNTLYVRAHYWDVTTSAWVSCGYDAGGVTGYDINGSASNPWKVKNDNGTLKVYFPEPSTGSMTYAGQWLDCGSIGTSLQNGDLKYVLFSFNHEYNNPTDAELLYVNYNSGAGVSAEKILTLTLGDDTEIPITVEDESYNKVRVRIDGTSIGVFNKPYTNDVAIEMELDHLNKYLDLDDDNSPRLSGGTWDDEGLYFDGTDDYIDTGMLFEPEGSFTIMTWFKHTITTAESRLIIGNNSYGGANTRGIELGPHGTGVFRCAMYDGSTWIAADSSDMYGDDVWTHAAMVFKSGEYLKLYINGEEIASTSTGATQVVHTTTNLMIGQAGNNSAYYKGYVGPTSVVYSALDEETIMEISKEFSTYSESSSGDLQINAFGQRDDTVYIEVNDGLNSEGTIVAVSNTILKKYAIGSNTSVTGLGLGQTLAVKELKPIHTFVTGAREILELREISSGVSGILVNGNELSAEASSTSGYIGYEFEVNSTKVKGNYLLIELVPYTKEGTGTLKVQDGIKKTYSWPITDEIEYNQYNYAGNGEVKSILLPDVETNFVKIILESGTSADNTLSLRVTNIEILTEEQIKGNNSGTLVLGSTDNGAIQYGNTFTLFDIGNVQDSNESSWEIEVNDYELTKKTLMSFGYRIDSNDNEEIIAKLGLHTGGGWYYLNLGKYLPEDGTAYNHVKITEYYHDANDPSPLTSYNPHIYPTSDHSWYRVDDETLPYNWFNSERNTAQNCAMDYLSDKDIGSHVYWQVYSDSSHTITEIYKTTKNYATSEEKSINDMDASSEPDLRNAWVNTTITLYDFFKEYYNKTITGTIDKVKLLINENSQNCPFGVSIRDISFSEYDGGLSKILNLGQDLRTNKKDVTTGVNLTDWLASPLYPLYSSNYETNLAKIDFVKNGGFEETEIQYGRSLPAEPWVSYDNVGDGRVYVTQVEKYSGTNSLALEGDSTWLPHVEQTIKPTDGGQIGGDYKVSLRVKLTGTITADQVKVELEWYSGNTTITVPNDGTEWTQIQKIINIDPAGSDDYIKITIRSSSESVIAYFDDIEIRAIGIDSNTISSDIANLRNIDINKMTDPNDYSRWAFLDGWYKISERYNSGYENMNNTYDDWYNYYQPYVRQEGYNSQNEAIEAGNTWLKSNPEEEYVYTCYEYEVEMQPGVWDTRYDVYKVYRIHDGVINAIPELSATAEDVIAAQRYVQYYYTDLYLEQETMNRDDYTITVDVSVPNTIYGPWYLWINDKYYGCEQNNDGEDKVWSNIQLTQGINKVLLGHTSDKTSNNELKFKVSLESSTSAQVVVLPPPESRTRQFAVYYDPQYNSQWIKRTSEIKTLNYEYDDGSTYNYEKKMIVNLPLNEQEGGYYDYVMDTSYNNNYGEIIQPSGQAAWKDGYMYFNGTSNDRVDLGDVEGLDGDLTISYWCKPTDIGAQRQNVVSKAYCGEFAITHETSGSISYYHGPNGNNSSGYMSRGWSNILTNNEWVNITIVRDISEQSVRLYKNGVDMGEGGTSWVSTSNSGVAYPLTIGDGYASNGFKGYVKGVKIWNYPLNEWEISSVVDDSYGMNVEDNVAMMRDSINMNILSIGMPAVQMNTRRLQYYIDTEIRMYDDANDDVVWHPFGQILSTTDVLPEEIWDGSQNDSLIEKYLELGGKIVFPGGYPAFSIRLAKAEPVPIDYSWPRWTTGALGGDHTDKYIGKGYFKKGTYELQYERYDADTTDEMGLKISNASHTIYTYGSSTGNNEWKVTTTTFTIPENGEYSLYGISNDPNSSWGVRKVHITDDKDKYIGWGVNYMYAGALGHQRILDIDDNNNPSSGRSDFKAGLFAYDSSGEYMDDDYDYKDENGNKRVLNDEYYYSPDRNTNFDFIKYSNVGGNHPAFTQSPWNGLKAHMILGKHEFDTKAHYKGDDYWKVDDIDGYSSVTWDKNSGHYNPYTGNAGGYREFYKVTKNLEEYGTDPMDQGLWFKPYLSDTKGAIEEGSGCKRLDEVGDVNYYLKIDDLGLEATFRHHELWNVGTGSVQAGEDGRGIISVLPMFDWDDSDVPIAGIQVMKSDESVLWDYIHNLYSDRGNGGLMNSPSTRDYVKNMLGLSMGSMMVSIALDNVLTNALRDNKTSSTNLLNPEFSDGQPLDKYPYVSSTRLAIRNNDTSGVDYDGQDGVEPEERYSNYPIYTGNYLKYCFANGLAINNGSVYPTISGQYSENRSITELVYEDNNLMTTIALETGKYYGETLDPHKYPQYLTLENISHNGRDTMTDGSEMVTLVAGIQTQRWNQESTMYGSDIEIDGNSKVSFGAQYGGTHKGNNYNTIREWEIYPKEPQDTLKSPAVYLSEYTDSSYIPWNNLVEHNNLMRRELIVRHPIVNNYNNQMAYELHLSDAFKDNDITFRGRYNNKNYGASMPWSYASAMIIKDEYNNGDAISTFDSITHIAAGMPTSTELSWKNTNEYYFSPDKLIDGVNMHIYGGGGNNNSGEAYQWLSPGPDHKIILENDSGTDYSVDIIRIAPSLNCRLDIPTAEGTKNVFLKVAQPKRVKVELLSDPDDESSIIKFYIIDMQRWQTTDSVIVVNPDRSEENALYPKAIAIQILDVWDRDYTGYQYHGSGAYLMEDTTYDAWNNYGGIAEVYLYGKPKDGSGNYQTISSEIEVFTTPEEAIRFNDQENNLFIDGGTYWTEPGEENEGFNRSMSVGSYNVFISASRNDKVVTSARYSATYNTVIQGVSTDFTAEFMGYWKNKIEEEKWVSLIKGAIQVVCMAVAAALVVAALMLIASGLFAMIGLSTAYTASIIATAAGTTFIKTLGVGLLIYGGILAVGLISPESSAFLSTIYFQLEDIIAGATVHAFVEIMDAAGAMISGKEIGSVHWWRQKVQPLLYGAYMLTLDIKGTVGRYLSAAVTIGLGLQDVSELNFTMFDPYERAMLAGESYNYLDFGGYFE